MKTYSAVIVSHQGTSPGVDFTYTVAVNVGEARGAISVPGLEPASGRPADWDVEAAPDGTPIR